MLQCVLCPGLWLSWRHVQEGDKCSGSQRKEVLILPGRARRAHSEPNIEAKSVHQGEFTEDSWQGWVGEGFPGRGNNMCEGLDM